MKAIISNWGRVTAWLMMATILLSRPVFAGITRPEAPNEPTPPAPPRAVIKIESVEPERSKDSAKDVTWLGVYAEEISEALGSQLGLKASEGLLVTYVATDSPAAKAGIQKNDVMVELRDQLLVHPAQLVKLIRAQNPGDTIKLTFYRQSKKQTTIATLGKRPEEFVRWSVMPSETKWKLEQERAIGGSLQQQVKSLHEDLMDLGADKEKIKIEVERSMEEARKALQDALRHQTSASSSFGLDAKGLEVLAKGSVNIGADTIVIVKKDGKTVKAILQTDDTGSYVVVANPKKRLTVHDQEGRMLFDGEIESQEQQQKVPAELWEKVKPMLQQLKPADGEDSKPHAQSGREPKS